MYPLCRLQGTQGRSVNPSVTQRRSLKPPRLRHSPYIPLRGTQRESLNVTLPHAKRELKGGKARAIYTSPLCGVSHIGETPRDGSPEERG